MTTEVVPDLASADAPAVPEASAPNIVRLPNGHVVTLEPELTVALGKAAVSVLSQGGGEAAIEYGLTSLWLGVHPSGEPYAIRAWSFVDGQGEPEPITREAIGRLLPFGGGGLEVAEAAGRLYGAAVVRPLLARQSKPSKPSRTGVLTPPSSVNGSSHQTPSKRSSRNGTAGRRSNG